jgi:hypothetical protein
VVCISVGRVEDRVRIQQFEKIIARRGPAASSDNGGAGDTGLATGPHPHMELYVDDLAVDPEQYIVFAF